MIVLGNLSTIYKQTSMDDEYDLKLTEAEMLVVMHAASEFYKAIADDDINDHRACILLNAFRKMKKAMTDKDNCGLLLSFNAILLGEDSRLKS